MSHATTERMVVLDTETTGLSPAEGHRIIEIGGIELINRRRTGVRWHEYLQPDREIDAEAMKVHGIDNAFLRDKPRFADIMPQLLEFLRDAELVIHNAPFDMGFLNHELRLAGADIPGLESICTITDSLVMARQMNPGGRNSLDALCKRYQVDASGRVLHGAILDAELLADVYLAMTGGQVALDLGDTASSGTVGVQEPSRVQRSGKPLKVILPDSEEAAAHAAFLATLERSAGGVCMWRGHGVRD